MLHASRCFAPTLLLLLAIPFAFGETYDEEVKKTDQTSADQVFTLAQWCSENNMPSKARQHLFQVIKLDKDHAEARALLGQVKIGDRWVAKNQLKEDQKAPAAGEKPLPVGPAPAAKDVAWNLMTVKDPAPANTFVNSYIERMQTVANDSNEMEVSVSTLTTAENLPTAIPRLCAALQKPTFTDLTGPSGIVQALVKDGRRADARVLFPYIAQASLRCTDPDDLMAFAFAASQIRDKRAVPRLIELMASDNKDLASSASEAISLITGLPRDSMTAEKATAWWGRFYRSDDTDILRAQLSSKDPDTALAAASQLGALQEKKVIDVLIEMLKSDDVKICAKAHLLVTTFTGRDWGYVATDPKEQRLKRIELLTKWWKENRENYVFAIDQRLVKDSTVVNDKGSAIATDPIVVAVRDLAATDAKLAAKAESELLNKAGGAVPALITGLESDNPITARKSHELLQRISKKSDIVFSTRDAADKKQKAIAAWKTWAIANKFLSEDHAEGQEEQ